MGAFHYATILARIVLPKALRSRFYRWFLGRRIERLPSRRYLHEVILPTLIETGCRSLLFVGVRNYNRRCLEFCRARKLELWTIDVDPSASSAGAPGRHIVGDVCSIDRLRPNMSVDATILNGVFGYGVDNEEQVNAAVAAVANVTKAGGICIVGWNPGHSPDYSRLASSKRYLRSTRIAKLAPRNQFPPDKIQTAPHIYDVYTVVK